MLADDAAVIVVALSPQEADRVLARDRFDLVLLDLSFRGNATTGLDLLDSIHSSEPTAHVIILSMYDDQNLQENVRRKGARGFVSKSAPPSQVREALRAVDTGGVWFPKSASSHRLTPRQWTIVNELSAGKSEKEVAKVLGVAVRTVEFHLAKAREAIGARTTGELLSHCAALGSLLETPPRRCPDRTP